MAEKVSERRAKLAYAQRLLNELIQLNNNAGRAEAQMVNAGVSSAEIVITLDKMLPGGGPPKASGPVALPEVVGDTITDRLINLLNVNVTGGVDWSAEAEAT